MIQSKAFQIVDEQQLPTDIQQWIRNSKVKKGVYSLKHDNRTYYLVSLGERPNPGFQIKLDKVEETNLKLIVFIKENTPARGTYYPQIITYPYFVARAEKPVEVKLVQAGKSSPFFS